MAIETTETLRSALFTTIEKVLDGKMDYQEASAIAKVAGQIINSADLEMRFAESQSGLDAEGQGINIGKMFLTGREENLIEKKP